MIKGLHHVAIGVPELQVGIDFYCEAFGLTVVERSSIENHPLASAAIGQPNVVAEMAMLKTSNCYIEMWQYSYPRPSDRVANPQDLGYPHIAFQVEGIDAEVARLTGLGMVFVGPAQNFGDISAVYGRDPFGNVIEIYEIRDPNRPQL